MERHIFEMLINVHSTSNGSLVHYVFFVYINKTTVFPFEYHGEKSLRLEWWRPDFCFQFIRRGRRKRVSTKRRSFRKTTPTIPPTGPVRNVTKSIGTNVRCSITRKLSILVSWCHMTRLLLNELSSSLWLEIHFKNSSWERLQGVSFHKWMTAASLWIY